MGNRPRSGKALKTSAEPDASVGITAADDATQEVTCPLVVPR
jgi:hypothetical protein